MNIFLIILITAAAIVFGFAKPLHMPETPAMLIAVLVLAAAVWISLFAYRSRAYDEREILHRAISFEWATVVGALVLAAGAVYQILTHQLDPWLIYAAAGMAITRAISHIYLDNNK